MSAGTFYQYERGKADGIRKEMVDERAGRLAMLAGRYQRCACLEASCRNCAPGRFDPPSDLQLPQISDVTASRVLAYGMRYSVAYSAPKYRATEAKELLEMFRELGPRANFWSDQLHEDFADGQPIQGVEFGQRITRCTFEVGVIAANEAVGFIWWRGEED